jgi:uncharacterized protein YqgQ
VFLYDVQKWLRSFQFLIFFICSVTKYKWKSVTLFVQIYFVHLQIFKL